MRNDGCLEMAQNRTDDVAPGGQRLALQLGDHSRLNSAQTFVDPAGSPGWLQLGHEDRWAVMALDAHAEQIR